MAEDMQVRSVSPLYAGEPHAAGLSVAHHFGKSPHPLGPEQACECQGHLATERHLASSSISAAVSARCFPDGAALQND